MARTQDRGVLSARERGRTAGDPGDVADKVIVSWQGAPLELGRRLNWEAQRGGLARASRSLFLGDGASWIWNLQQDRGRMPSGWPDFYQASQHCWNLWRAVRGEKDRQLPRWMDRRLHGLRHGRRKERFARNRRFEAAGGRSRPDRRARTAILPATPNE